MPNITRGGSMGGVLAYLVGPGDPRSAGTG